MAGVITWTYARHGVAGPYVTTAPAHPDMRLGLDIGGEPSLERAGFTGRLDDVRLFNRALTAGEIKALYLGSGPVLQLGFEQPWATEGTSLPDASGWSHDATLHTGTSDAANKAITGQVGNYASSFDGVDDSVDAGDVNEADGLGDFTIAQWFSLDALATAASGKDWATPVGKGAYNAGNGWAVLVNRDSATVGNHKVRLYFNGAVVADIPAPTGGWQAGKWYHFAFTRQRHHAQGLPGWRGKGQRIELDRACGQQHLRRCWARTTSAISGRASWMSCASTAGPCRRRRSRISTTPAGRPQA